MGIKIAIDVGGTFTDLVYTTSNDAVHVVKTLSTPRNQAEGVIDGLRKIAQLENMTLSDLLGKTEVIIHGSTVATNTMLEFNGARVGLITTRGFRDDIELRRGYKEKMFDPRYPAPIPIVLRRHRLTVAERIDREGKILIPLDENEAVEQVRKLKESGIESIAVCLLFSFLNPIHEKKIAEIIRQEHPDAFISLSHEVLPQIREFERVSTTLVNAYVGPKLKKYLDSLLSELYGLGFKNDFFVMLSNGGIMNAEYAAKYAVTGLLSGPAGGIEACTQLIAELMGKPDLITVDMGGTSFDVSLIKDKRPSLATDFWFSRYRIMTPMLSIHTIGAGGGSIAWVDSGGALKVGPISAGADPGPACYGKGGKEPTVTDANLMLGYLNPDYFLGGDMKLDAKASSDSIYEKIAKPLQMNVTEAAHGIFRIVNNNMSGGIRAVSIQKGYDPREFTLVAFGGNGAVHAGLLAKELGIKNVIVPRIATAFSARGMLCSNIVINKVRTYIGTTAKYDLSKINRLIEEMKQEVGVDLPESVNNQTGFMRELTYNYYIDMHYKGELHEITVKLGSTDGLVGDNDIVSAAEDFHKTHETLHTFSNRGETVFIMNIRLEAIVHTAKLPLIKQKKAGRSPHKALKGERRVYFEDVGGFIDCPIYNGMQLRCGNTVEGPCVIEEPATNIVIFPEQTAVIDEYDNYVIKIY
jgi:N-methylhydantoinase A